MLSHHFTYIVCISGFQNIKGKNQIHQIPINHIKFCPNHAEGKFLYKDKLLPVHILTVIFVQLSESLIVVCNLLPHPWKSVSWKISTVTADDGNVLTQIWLKTSYYSIKSNLVISYQRKLISLITLSKTIWFICSSR